MDKEKLDAALKAAYESGGWTYEECSVENGHAYIICKDDQGAPLVLHMEEAELMKRLETGEGLLDRGKAMVYFHYASLRR